MSNILITLPSGVLRVEDGSSINIDLVNPIFLVDGDVLPGSYTFPFTVNLGIEERKLLKFPDRKDRADNVVEQEGCTMFYDGVPLFHGSVLVLGASDYKARLSFLIRGFAKFEDFNIRDLDLGEVNVDPNDAAVKTHAKNTAIQPELYNHVFTPVFNPSYFDEDWKDNAWIETETITEEERWNRRIQNYYNPDSGQFEGRALTPFVKLYAVIVKCFERFGVVLDDQFFDEELQRIYLYNNISINNYNNSLASTWKVSDYLPYAKAIELLKELRKTFCLAIIPDPFNKKVTIRKIKDILNRPPTVDWTSKQVTGYENVIEDILPKSFGYDEVTDDAAMSYFDGQKITSTPYYLNTNMYFASGDLLDPYKPFVLKLAIIFQRLNTSGKSADFLSKLVPLINANGSFFVYINQFITGQNLDLTHLKYFDMPMVDMGGSVNQSFVEGEPKSKESKLSSLRTIFYRGFRYHKPKHDGPTYFIPYAQAGPYDPAIVNLLDPLGTYSESTDEYSLLWNGEKGLNDQFFKEYIYMLEEGKITTQPLRLSITDVLNFRYDDKVRVDNNDYLVKNLRLNLGKNGITAVANLIRTE